MTFKRRRRANTLLPANTDVPANAAMPAMRQKCTYGNMTESELLCVKVATLLRNKYASALRVSHKAMHVWIVKIFFYCSRYLPSLNYCPGKNKINKHRHFSGHNLDKGKLKSQPICVWFVEVFFTIVGCDAAKNYMFLKIHDWYKWLELPRIVSFYTFSQVQYWTTWHPTM